MGRGDWPPTLRKLSPILASARPPMCMLSLIPLYKVEVGSLTDAFSSWTA